MPAAISAPQPLAVEAGARVLMSGGNAVDAAVTAALVQAIVNPQMCGIGGYAVINLHLANEQGSVGVDAPALAGALVRDDMWVEKLIRPNPGGWGFFLEGNVNEAGYTSVCTPGAVKMYAMLLDRWGTIDFGQAAQPAIRIAHDGYTVSDAQAVSWKRSSQFWEGMSLRDYIHSNAEARRIYLRDDGETYDIGQTLRNPDYAASLRHIIEHGSEDFYHGELMERMASDLEANGSFVTRQDFEQYRLREDASVRGSYRGHAVSSSAPPHGGVTLVAILNILEGYDLAGMGHNSPEYIYTVGLAMKAAFADRNPHLADTDFEDVPLDWMMSKERAAYWREHIDFARPPTRQLKTTEAGGQIGQPIEPTPSSAESPHTTHLSVIDAQGNCVSLTHSLGASSGVITPGLGFMYNNSMVNFNPLPGHPNSIAPGKGRTTGMTPTIVYRKASADRDAQAQEPLLVLGAPGATRIITSVLQVILNVIDFGMDIDRAVHAPRFDCQLDAISCQRRIPIWVLDEVNKRYPAIHIPYSHGGLALVHALHIDPQTGALTGAADTGNEGMAVVV